MIMLNTTTSLLNAAPVQWAALVERWKKNGPGCGNFPPAPGRSTIPEVVNDLDVAAWVWVNLADVMECECGRKRDQCATFDGEKEHGDR